MYFVVFPVDFRRYFDSVTGFSVDQFLFFDAELVVIEVRWAAEVVIGEIRPEE